MEPKKSWVRWTASNKIFPKPKYGFSQHLQRRGDYLVTNPIGPEEYEKFRKAILFWAWYHKRTVTVKKERCGKDLWEVRVDLVSMTRERDYG